MTLDNVGTPNFLAEHLPRLNSISISIDLKPSLISNIYITGNDTLNINTDTYDNYTFKLPTITNNYPDLKPLLEQQLSLNATSFKLPSTSPSNKNIINQQQFNSDNYKWTVKYLKLKLDPQSKTCLNCSRCSKTLIKFSDLRSLKPMPSETWSEMMDFWHCHKPAEGKYSNKEILERFSGFKVAPNCILVGGWYFVLNLNEFEGLVEKPVEMNKDTDSEDKTIHCKFCDSKVGDLDVTTGNHRIFKWNLSLGYSTPDNKPVKESFRPSLYVYTYLLDSINSTAARFYLIQCPENPDKQMLTWCFNFGLGVSMISSSAEREQIVMTDCLKVMYSNERAKIDKLISDDTAGKFEALELDEFMYDDLYGCLTGVTEQLPAIDAGMGIMQDWNNGYLSLDM